MDLSYVILRRKASSSDDSVSGDSSSEESLDESGDNTSSSDEEEGLDPTSNTAMFEDIYPPEDRPARYRKAKVFDKLPVESITAMINAQQKKKKASVTDPISKLTKLKPRKFKKGRDDGYSKLHKARFLRKPYGQPKKWWAMMPVNRDKEGVCLDMPLEFMGCANSVASKALLHLHDRSYPLQLKMMAPDNVNVATRARKRIERMEAGEVTTLTDFWWTDVTAIKAVQDCILNFGAVLNILWPLDPTGWIMLRVLHKYGWVAVSSDEGKRVTVILRFFDSVIKENCQRAVNKRPPMSSEEQEAMLKRTLCSFGLKDEVPFLTSGQDERKLGQGTSAGGGSNNGGSGGGGIRGQNKQGFRSNNGRKREFASYNGMGTYYEYNNPGGNKCRNKRGSASSSCKDPNSTKELAHVCNKFVVSKNTFCLGKHSRAEHR